MIYSIEGKIEKITTEFLVINVNGIGYQVFAPKSLLEEAKKGKKIKSPPKNIT